VSTNQQSLETENKLAARRRNKVRVLIVDDSATMRKTLTEILESDRAIEVVGTAPDPLIARVKIKKLNPDVLTLDIEMPKMDGVTFLRNLMRLHPLPVVMISSFTNQGAEITLDALELGAVDFVTKPKADVAHSLDMYAREITRKVKMAVSARVRPLEGRSAKPMSIAPKLSADAVLAKRSAKAHVETAGRIIAIGASTGGIAAIQELLMQMPPDSPGVVVAQHIPPAFSAAFTRRMDDLLAMTVLEARDGQQILPGHVYVAPGDRHLIVTGDGTKYACRISEGPPVNRHRPSVDVLFRSVAQNAGKNAVGVILTGMGDDGARGLKEMHEAGAATLAQDQHTSVVWGMPGEAVKRGGVDRVLPLARISEQILSLVTA